MNERLVTNFLNKHITQDLVNALAQSTNSALPGAGVVVGILGALVMRAVAAANAYIDQVDRMPIVPPEIPAMMTYSEAIQFFEEKKLTGMFSKLLKPTADQSNPDINRARVLVTRAASVVKKCFNEDGSLFKVFYHDQITHGEYLTVWETYGEFLEFNSRLRALLPPADFKPLLDAVNKAVAKEGMQQIEKSQAYQCVKQLIEEQINKVVPGNLVNLDKIIDQLGNID